MLYLGKKQNYSSSIIFYAKSPFFCTLTSRQTKYFIYRSSNYGYGYGTVRYGTYHQGTISIFFVDKVTLFLVWFFERWQRIHPIVSHELAAWKTRAMSTLHRHVFMMPLLNIRRRLNFCRQMTWRLPWILLSRRSSFRIGHFRTSKLWVFSWMNNRTEFVWGCHRSSLLYFLVSSRVVVRCRRIGWDIIVQRQNDIGNDIHHHHCWWSMRGLSCGSESYDW